MFSKNSNTGIPIVFLRYRGTSIVLHLNREIHRILTKKSTNWFFCIVCLRKVLFFSQTIVCHKLVFLGKLKERICCLLCSRQFISEMNHTAHSIVGFVKQGYLFYTNKSCLIIAWYNLGRTMLLFFPNKSIWTPDNF